MKKEKIARVIRLELEYEGYETSIAATGKAGLRALYQHPFDLVLLDIMLPELSGLEVLRRIRSSGNTVPVILLTAKDSVPDKVSGLDQGANDYVTKPFQIEELLARIRSCLRIQHTLVEKESGETLHVGDLTVDEGTRDVMRGSQPIELTPREFDLLVYMMKNENQVLTRDQILSAVWGYDYYGDTNVVDVYIRYLRKKIDQHFKTPLIHTIRGVGYSIKGP